MDLRQAILRDADRCVLCGMCLPYCPTYARNGNEAESPRGRISLMLAFARRQLALTPALMGHLDSCLACGMCETKCPSEVRYVRLIGNSRRLIAEQRRASWGTRLLVAFASRAKWLRAGVGAARTGPGRIALRFLGMKAIAALIPRPVPTASATMEVPPPTAPRGRVALFVGCTGEAFDTETLRAARTLLRAAGYVVETPAQQTCCGALHHHQGIRSGFERHARINVRAFAGHWDAVVFVASGCGSMLREYGEWLEAPEAAAFAARCVEITDFLAREGFPTGTCFREEKSRVAIHLPCSQANMLRAGTAAERLLRLAPGIELSLLPDNTACCGAAGSYMLTHPAEARALRKPKLDALECSGAQYLVTTNVGCALHLAAGARARGMALEVVHPVAFLARRLVAIPGSALAASADSH